MRINTFTPKNAFKRVYNTGYKYFYVVTLSAETWLTNMPVEKFLTFENGIENVRYIHAKMTDVYALPKETFPILVFFQLKLF